MTELSQTLSKRRLGDFEAVTAVHDAKKAKKTRRVHRG
jgi:hypothetical protein